MAYVTKASFGIIRCLYTPEAVGGARVVWFKEDQLISASLSRHTNTSMHSIQIPLLWLLVTISVKVSNQALLSVKCDVEYLYFIEVMTGGELPAETCLRRASEIILRDSWNILID